MKKLKCDLCGTPVKIVGHTTKHYEPIVPSVEEIKVLIERHGIYLSPELDAFSMHKSSVGKLAEAIRKLIRGE
jgi:hypothetical protein